MTAQALCEAIKKNDMAAIRHLVEDQQVDLHARHLNFRPIDAAAMCGNLEVINYLLSKGATLAQTAGPRGPNFLFWVCSCAEPSLRTDILLWLTEKKRYEHIGEGVTKAHVEAALSGKLNRNRLIPDGNGLNQLHYAIWTDLYEVRNLTPDSLNKVNETLQNGYLRGASLASLLLYTRQGARLLAMLEQSPDLVIDFNAMPLYFGYLNTGITLLHQTAAIPTAVNPVPPVPLNKALLQELLKHAPDVPINLNSSSQLLDNGVSLATLLVDMNLVEHLRYIYSRYPQKIDLNFSKAGFVTLSYLLIHRQQPELLEEFLRGNPVEVNLNEAPTQEDRPGRGISMAWMLFIQNQGDYLYKLLLRYPQQIINLHAAPLANGHPLQNRSVGTLAVMNKAWNILQETFDRTGRAKRDPRETILFVLNNNELMVNALVNEGKEPILRTLLDHYEFDVLDVLISELLENKKIHENVNTRAFLMCYFAERLEKEIKILMQMPEALNEELKNSVIEQLERLIKLLNKVPPESRFFETAQHQLTLLWGDCRSKPWIMDPLMQLPEVARGFKEFRFMKPRRPDSIGQMMMIQHGYRAGEPGNNVANAMLAETLFKYEEEKAQKEKAQRELEQLKEENEGLKNKLKRPQENFAGKRPKIPRTRSVNFFEKGPRSPVSPGISDKTGPRSPGNLLGK